MFLYQRGYRLYLYLGVMIDSKLNFKAQVKKVCNQVKFSVSNFRFTRDYMSTETAMMSMYSIVISHITFCLTTWSQASTTTLKSLQSLYKQTLKILEEIGTVSSFPNIKKNTNY